MRFVRITLALIVVLSCLAMPVLAEEKKQIVIGFNNMFTDIEFFQTVEKGLEDAAAAQGIKIIKAYAQRDAQKMITNVDSFVLQGVDLVMDFNVLPEVGTTLAKTLKEKGIPLIGIDGVYEGAYFFGVNNEQVGRTAGAYAAEVIKKKWNGQLDYIVHMYSESAGPAVKKRNSGASDVIKETFKDFPEDHIIWLDGGSHMDAVNAKAMTTDFLTAHPDAKHIYFQVLTDLPALGVLMAVEAANKMDDSIIISCDAGGPALDNLRKPEANSWIGSVAAFPEKYGENLISYALEILEKKDAAPKEKFTNNVVITRDNINEYYPVQK